MTQNVTEATRYSFPDCSKNNINVPHLFHPQWFLVSIMIILWRHQMKTFSASNALCAGNSPVTKPTFWQTIFSFSSTFSWKNMYKVPFRLHWKLFPRVQLTTFQHWFRYWLGAWRATSHYLNLWWLVSDAYIRYFKTFLRIFLSLRTLTRCLVHAMPPQ